jgi:hypothetical protein
MMYKAYYNFDYQKKIKTIYKLFTYVCIFMCIHSTEDNFVLLFSYAKKVQLNFIYKI